MANWQPTKQNWAAQDSVTDNTLNRIEGNTQYLYDQYSSVDSTSQLAKSIAENARDIVNTAISDTVLFRSNTNASGAVWNITTTLVPYRTLYTVAIKIIDKSYDNQLISVNGSVLIPIFLVSGVPVKNGTIMGSASNPVTVLVAVSLDTQQAFLLAGGTRDYTKLINKPSINGNELRATNTTEDLGIVADNIPFSSPTIPDASTVKEAIDILAGGGDTRRIGDMYFTGALEHPGPNYLECVGGALDEAQYPELFDVIGDQYGYFNGEFSFANMETRNIEGLPPSWSGTITKARGRDSSFEHTWALAWNTLSTLMHRVNLKEQMAYELVIPQDISSAFILEDGFIWVTYGGIYARNVMVYPPGNVTGINITGIFNVNIANTIASYSFERLESGYLGFCSSATLYDTSGLSSDTSTIVGGTAFLYSSDGISWGSRLLRNLFVPNQAAGNSMVSLLDYSAVYGAFTLYHSSPRNEVTSDGTRMYKITLVNNTITFTDLYSIGHRYSYNAVSAETYTLIFIYACTLGLVYSSRLFLRNSGGTINSAVSIVWLDTNTNVPISTALYSSTSTSTTYLNCLISDLRVKYMANTNQYYLSVGFTGNYSTAIPNFETAPFFYQAVINASNLVLVSYKKGVLDNLTSTPTQYSAVFNYYDSLEISYVLIARSTLPMLIGQIGEPYGNAYRMELSAIDTLGGSYLNFIFDSETLWFGATGPDFYVSKALDGFLIPDYSLKFPKCYIKAK